MARRGPKPGTVIPRPPHDIITQGGAVGVLLSNRPWRVWVDLADFTSIIEKHGNRSWSWIEAAQYIRLRPDGRTGMPLARLIVGEKGRFIRFKDGDRLNLRRANLSTQDAMMPVERAKRVPAVPKAKALLPKAPSPSLVLSPHRKVVVPKQAVRVVPAVKRSQVP